ncbi:MAG: SDR family oxidoreductase [Chloroflexi bacterium]|nr:SDR family oxidoreductase [Chloroflexota bacterium]
MPEEKIAIVTGSSRGIGRGIAQRLAQDGYTIVVNYLRDAGAAQETVALAQTHTPRSLAIQADVATPEGAKRLMDETLTMFGQIDVLVNNAGPFLVKSVLDTEIDEWRRTLDGNLSSAFYCIKYVLPSMRAHKRGNIVNLGSLNVETVRGAPTTAAYNAAKSGVVVLTKSVARSEARYGIRCNIVNPGFVETYATTDADRRELPSLVPLGSLGAPNDIAEMIAFLVSDKARYVTGAVVNVHGGLWV